jgi:hypothetical protein
MIAGEFDSISKTDIDALVAAGESEARGFFIRLMASVSGSEAVETAADALFCAYHRAEAAVLMRGSEKNA